LLLFLLKFGVLFICFYTCAFNFQLCWYCLKVLVLIFYMSSSLMKLQSFWLCCLNVFNSFAWNLLTFFMHIKHETLKLSTILL
jgi:hypothetical protein